MENRVAIIAILVTEKDSVSTINDLLHEYADYIIGRLGLPYRQKQVNIISVVLDAPQDKVSALAGKIGKLPGVTAQTIFSK
ncbi:MAG: iron-only hydrogenase system regulator [Desulfovibrionaceae bacterium]|nr:iron-only hydrogenase system regulator [Desulfovibrionaceae bacterium]